MLIRAYVKNPLVFILFIVALIISIALVVLDFISQLNNDTDCQKYNYTEKLNGGVKEFQSNKFTINLCGSGANSSHIFGDSMDKVELTILNDKGELLAKRRYNVFWDGQLGHAPLSIGSDRISYQDDDDQKDYTIVMPPNWFEWIRARIALLN